LVQCLDYAEDNLGRSRVMKALAQIRNPNVIPELAKLLHLTELAIPVEVIQALGEFQDNRVIPDLSDYLLHGARNFVERKATIDAFVRIGHSDGIESIYAHFNKHVTGTSADDHNICSHAVGSIRDIGGEKALLVLQEAYAQNDRHYKYYSMDIDNALRQVQQQLIQGNKQ
jgi:HEAT repeat protein